MFYDVATLTFGSENMGRWDRLRARHVRIRLLLRADEKDISGTSLDFCIILDL